MGHIQQRVSEGYFSEDSMMRRVHRERALALSAQRALLMQAAHPLAVALLPDRVREQYGLAPLPPLFIRRALVAGLAGYCGRAVIPFLPDRLRLVPSARAA